MDGMLEKNGWYAGEEWMGEREMGEREIGER